MTLVSLLLFLFLESFFFSFVCLTKNEFEMELNRLKQGIMIAGLSLFKLVVLERKTVN